ncbi:methionine ABC transporter substrate-binding protein [Mumia zhuanghuii]|uniref:MetQ/NlpA family ABC transporter substrate-binding protein n=2 Tax=Mumia TaxID=1546255 RepID=A0ABW1QHD2_9ACTN|nr:MULTISPECIES: MetQ/NlpA family ABC transporter substrate-binding protein [Mumia]KAA1424605.1 methionine ABC transporter substrate-binding protein [Mumia zhuanghuii]
MSEQVPQVAPPKSRKGLWIVAAVAALVVAVLAYVLVAGGDDDAEGATKVRLGVVGASDPYWKTFKDEAAKEDIDVEVVDFSDYAQPNPSVSEGEIDINQFQHIIYLADYNVKNDDDLYPIGSTAIYPLGLYSQKVDSVDAIKDGDTVVVPDDDTNQARALLLLQSAGLISLKDGGSPFSTLNDVESDSKVKVQAIKADLTPTSLPDVAAAVINNDFVEKAGLSFSDALVTDDASDPKAQPYVNIFAVRAEDKDNETYRKLVEIYQTSQPVIDGVQEVSGNTAEIVKIPDTDLEKTLSDVESQIQEQ